MLIVRVAEDVAGDVLAFRVEHDDESVALSRARHHPAAKVRAPFQRTGDGHEAFRTHSQGAHVLISPVPKRLLQRCWPDASKDARKMSLPPALVSAPPPKSMGPDSDSGLRPDRCYRPDPARRPQSRAPCRPSVAPRTWRRMSSSRLRSLVVQLRQNDKAPGVAGSADERSALVVASPACRDHHPVAAGGDLGPQQETERLDEEGLASFARGTLRGRAGRLPAHGPATRSRRP